jgi:hypothetical protein
LQRQSARKAVPTTMNIFTAISWVNQLHIKLMLIPLFRWGLLEYWRLIELALFKCS